MKQKLPSKERVKRAIGVFAEDMRWMFDHGNSDLTITYADKDDGTGTTAEVTYTSKYRRMSLVIYPNFFTDTPALQREYLLHEFCHTFSHDLKDKSHELVDGRLHTKTSLDETNEECTSRISEIMHRLMTGKYKRARGAYKRYVDSLS